MNHEAAVLAAADDFAFDVQPEMLRFVEGGVEGSKRHRHAALGHLVEIVFLVLIVFRRDEIPRYVSAERMMALRPAVGEYEALEVGAADGFDADEVAHLALGPVGGGDEVRDAVDLRAVRRQMDQDARQHMLLLEREVVGDEEGIGVLAIVHADGDHVPGIEVAEKVLADIPDGLRLDVQEKPVVLGDVHSQDRPVEAVLDLVQYFTCRHRAPLNRYRPIAYEWPSSSSSRGSFFGIPPIQWKYRFTSP